MFQSLAHITLSLSILRYEEAVKDKSVIDKLRWSTLGYHHDWDTKVTRKSLNIKLQLIIFSNIVKKTRENFHQSLDNYVNIYPLCWATPTIHQRLPL